MGKYIKCPRCDLNYIPDTEEMCDVCKAELGLKTDIVLIDEIMNEDEPLRLCPVCKTNFIGPDEKMCESCLSNEERSREETADDMNDDEWRSYLDDEDTADANEESVEIPLDELEKEYGEEEDDEEFEDEENPPEDDDDFDDIPLEDEDFDDDEDDEDEDDDDEDDEE